MGPAALDESISRGGGWLLITFRFSGSDTKCNYKESSKQSVLKIKYKIYLLFNIQQYSQRISPSLDN